MIQLVSKKNQKDNQSTVVFSILEDTDIEIAYMEYIATIYYVAKVYAAASQFGEHPISAD